jgi:hypothetical protein
LLSIPRLISSSTLSLPSPLELLAEAPTWALGVSGVYVLIDILGRV